MNKPLLLVALLVLWLSGCASERERHWEAIDTQNLPDVRSENAFARVGDRFYLLGGRGDKVVEMYDPATNRWEKKAAMPIEMHHFQALTYGDEIYVVGALTGPYPHEDPVPNIYIYNPEQDQWRQGAAVPEGRRRGAAAATVYNDKIYVICGIQDGHWDGHVAWMDEYDPQTNTWERLADAPRPRDHVQAAVIGDQLVLAGGRNSTARTGHVLDTTIPEVDVYDFGAGEWRTLPATANIPTQRAGCTAVPLDGRAVIIGGESPQKLAHSQTEALDLQTETWLTLDSLTTGRHGTQAVLYKGDVYIAAGSANQGGGPELNTIEVMK
ncbi:N-acetylneuraminic acid mutarotase [Catalinimonas alkaloidigena]|uniref:N-acetylneuraminic acid mutarotase n=1 Tax=Catalinimonas alkaloidigena TaxID=1075417 RepID=A0A1G9HV74_9BACT|nr:kelch repeat-containing protein [Catalinimonas alkaloidigena]SDL16877.1 N-acetylneuraminic acid mutarotase [Catalinimonas alkaloidigena]